MKGSLDFIFFEKNVARANHLNRVLDSRRGALRHVSNVKVITGDFSDKMSELLDTLEAQRRQNEPYVRND